MAQNANELPIKEKKDFRFTLGGGYSYRLGKLQKTDNRGRDFGKDMRHGFNVESSGQLFFNENYGIGMNAIYMRQQEARPDISLPGIIGIYRYKLRETTQFFYVGPAFAARVREKKLSLYAEAGAGLLVFDDRGDIDLNKVKLTHATVGVHIGISPEYRLSSHLGVGLKLSVTTGFMRTSYYGYKTKTWNLSNASMGAFISFRSK